LISLAETVVILHYRFEGVRKDGTRWQLVISWCRPLVLVAAHEGGQTKISESRSSRAKLRNWLPARWRFYPSPDFRLRAFGMGFINWSVGAFCG
jgi:hypothetical protein